MAGLTTGFSPGLGYFSCRAMPMVARTPPGNAIWTSLRFSSIARYFAAGLFGDGLGQLDGISLYREIDFEDGKAAQHVAHRATGEKNIRVGLRSGGLKFGHHPALVGAQVALEHKHVIAHRFALS